MFAAGLVLGFSMFAQGESRFDMDNSFHGAREVLKKLADYSPQAEHYYEILTGFADAIQRYRQHLSRDKWRNKNKYVNQILTLDMNPSVSGSQSDLSPRALSRDPADSVSEAAVADGTLGNFGFQGPFQFSDTTQLPMEGGGGFDFGLFGWDNFAMQISENFSFDNEPAWGIT